MNQKSFCSSEIWHGINTKKYKECQWIEAYGEERHKEIELKAKAKENRIVFRLSKREDELLDKIKEGEKNIITGDMHEPPIKTKVYAKDIKDAEQIIEKTITATLKKGDNDKL